VYGSQVLREETQDVDKDYPELKKLAEDMFETMYSANGVGLAAPQIGLPIRMFVVDITPYADENPAYADFRRVFINPEIYEESAEEVSMGEGCLSLPGFSEDVYRPERIRIRWLDEDFNERDEEFGAYAARVIQHEYDHLEGTVFTDRINPLRKTLLRSKLSAMSKGKYSAGYKTKQVK
jgi:peptide deformylase